jgi:hypothetical protein
LDHASHDEHQLVRDVSFEDDLCPWQGLKWFRSDDELDNEVLFAVTEENDSMNLFGVDREDEFVEEVRRQLCEDRILSKG